MRRSRSSGAVGAAERCLPLRGFAVGHWIVLVWVLCLSAACAERVPARDQASKRELTLPSYAFGLFGSPRVDTRDVCASGVRELRMGRSGQDFLLSALTLGLYFPRRLYVTCEGQNQP
jgi:hypothetical protein